MKRKYQAGTDSICGLGTDIVEISRIKKTVETHESLFLKQFFTENEIAYCQRHKNMYVHLAGRFAAKEAIAKALGTGFGKSLAWLDIEITNDRLGHPEVSLDAKVLERFGDISVLLSISHCKEYATATAILLKFC